MAGPALAGRRRAVTDWTSLSYAVVDVEGNGQQPPGLVELAVASIRGGVIGKPVSWLVKPDHPISYFATQLHGLTAADVADCPKVQQIATEAQAALAADALIAHNAHVDVGVLQRELSGWQPPEVFDTSQLARRLVPDLDSYRLGHLVVLC
jgi:DNA polymerase III epsilon subunit-like protein